MVAPSAAQWRTLHEALDRYISTCGLYRLYDPFTEIFGWGQLPDDERALRFMVGLAPRLLQDYLVDTSRVNLAQRFGPSTVMACQLCAGVAGTEALKILLGRGKVRAAPYGMQFDPYRQRMVSTHRPGGNRHPMTRLVLAIARKRLASMKAAAAR